MTLINEKSPSKMLQYKNLLYVEYLEMICRLAEVAKPEKDLIEYKVVSLLEVVYDLQFKAKVLNMIDNPLRKVDEKYKHYKDK